MSSDSRSSTGAIRASESGPAKPLNGPQPVRVEARAGHAAPARRVDLRRRAPVLGRLLVGVGVAESLASEKRRPTNVMLVGRPGVGREAGRDADDRVGRERGLADQPELGLQHRVEVVVGAGALVEQVSR